MIDFEIEKHNRILFMMPRGPLTERDFKELSENIDKNVSNDKDLNGILIDTESFPEWDDFDSMKAHVNFIKTHHKMIHKVAVVSDNAKLSAIPTIAQHFVESDVRHFRHKEKLNAIDWLKN